MPRPFLKWAGNKYRVAMHIRNLLPPGKRLIEPFAGSCAVFLNTDYPSYLLCDANPDLINLYQVLQREGPKFIEYCKGFFTSENNTSERYYELREEFNATTDCVKKAAIFVYLNRHCYNGLCRYNSSSQFNVPFHRNKKAYFPEKEMLYFWQKSRHAVFLCCDFRESMAMAEPGDVVYCDPPYVPLSATENFTAYTGNGFGIEEHRALAQEARKLAGKGIPVLLSNHDTEFTRNLYAGAKIVPLEVRRFISRDGRNRKKVGEILALFKAKKNHRPAIPGSVRTLFWDTDPEKLDFTKHKKFVIERILEFGDEEAYRWMFRTYSDEDIVEAARASRNISQKTALMIANCYNVPETEFTCLKENRHRHF